MKKKFRICLLIIVVVLALSCYYYFRYFQEPVLDEVVSKEEAMNMVSEKYPANFYSISKEKIIRLIEEKKQEKEYWKVNVDILEEPIMTPGNKLAFKIEVLVDLKTKETFIYKMYD